MLAQEVCLTSNVRPVTTRFFGKSVNTGRMTARIPILTLLCALVVGCCAHPAVAQPAAPVTSVGAEELSRRQQVANVQLATNPRRLVEAAAAALEANRSITAEISQEVDLFGKRLIGSGAYFEQAGEPDRLMRLELRLQLGNKTSSLVQVCDGKILWTYRELLGTGSLRKVDVAQVTKALKAAGKPGNHGGMGALPGLGGLPGLLRGLDGSFDFKSAQRGILKLRDDRLPVWQLRGEWKPAKLAKVLPEQKKAIAAGEPPDLSKLPEQMPEYVLLMLGHDDLFPYRLEYHRTVRSAEETGAGRPLVTMQFYEVVRNAPIARHRFQYSPGNLEFEDDTKQFLKSLDVKD